MSFPNSVEAEAVYTLPNGVSVKVKKRAEYDSKISWEDSWQNAYALAKEAAEAELKNILAKIENDNMTIVELVGPQGPRGFKGQPGKSYTKQIIDASSGTLQLSDNAMDALDKLAMGAIPDLTLELSYKDIVEYSKDLEAWFSASVVNSWEFDTTYITPSSDMANYLDYMLSRNRDAYQNMVKMGIMKINKGNSPRSNSPRASEDRSVNIKYFIKLLAIDLVVIILVASRKQALSS